MTSFLAVLHQMWAFCAANPWTVFFAVYGLINLLWAQLPKPTNPSVLRLWVFAHGFLQLIVTHKDDPGTFTLPGMLKIFSESALKHAVPKAPDERE